MPTGLFDIPTRQEILTMEQINNATVRGVSDNMLRNWRRYELEKWKRAVLTGQMIDGIKRANNRI